MVKLNTLNLFQLYCPFLVFKVYAIEEDRFREICNVRGSKHLYLGFSCNDVSWSPVDGYRFRLYNFNTTSDIKYFRSLYCNSSNQWSCLFVEPFKNGKSNARASLPRPYKNCKQSKLSCF